MKVVKRKTRKNFKSLLLLITAFIAVIMAFYYGMQILSLKNDEKVLAKELETLSMEEKDLNSEIARLKDPEYIAKYIREKFFLLKPNEYKIKSE